MPSRHYHDISAPLSSRTLSYPGDPSVRVRACCGIDPHAPGSYRLSEIALSPHSGTHLDPPSPVLAEGDDLCAARAARPDGASGADLLDRDEVRECERLLFKTPNSALRRGGQFVDTYAHLTPDAACFLRDHTSVRLVGIDYLSVDAWHATDLPVHHVLLGAPAPIWIAENLLLDHVPQGHYTLTCLPLRIAGGDGGPCRAILWEE